MSVTIQYLDREKFVDIPSSKNSSYTSKKIILLEDNFYRIVHYYGRKMSSHLYCSPKKYLQFQSLFQETD